MHKSYFCFYHFLLHTSQFYIYSTLIDIIHSLIQQHVSIMCYMRGTGETNMSKMESQSWSWEWKTMDIKYNSTF